MTKPNKPVLEIQRSTVPDTNLLENRILQATATMPQAIREHQTHSNNRVWQSLISLFTVKPYLMAGGSLIACSALLALSVSLFLPNNTTTIVDVVENNESTLSDELVWQDLMLMHDELAFNDL